MKKKKDFKEENFRFHKKFEPLDQNLVLRSHNPDSSSLVVLKDFTSPKKKTTLSNSSNPSPSSTSSPIATLSGTSASTLTPSIPPRIIFPSTYRQLHHQLPFING